MSEPLQVVAIDGPSGVGKSTISRRVAARLGYTYLDTGAMYRAVALKCRMAGIEATDEAAVAAILPPLNIQLLPARSEGEEARVVLDGVEVSEQIRTPEISMLASAVSALRPVRATLTRMQQDIGSRGRIVAEGRDTGTVVFPGAVWKIYLDATPEERARRRVRQLRERGGEIDEGKILAQIVQRDRDDSERTIAPLKAAPDAVCIDSTGMTVEEVVERVLDVVLHQQKKAG
ncbi:MAG TPA: (d)CMP kinase [Desulfobulbaceae bacterium]|nr:(d)CMP kinase [Desulfobulbaceae bacterium]